MLDWSGSRVREDALKVLCPHCKSGIGVECINPINGQPLRGFPAHINRLNKSKEIEA
jgi:hypothetical protein